MPVEKFSVENRTNSPQIYNSVRSVHRVHIITQAVTLAKCVQWDTGLATDLKSAWVSIFTLFHYTGNVYNKMVILPLNTGHVYRELHVSYFRVKTK